MDREAVSTDDAPQAIGPYSQAIVANGFVFCSGTAGIDPATGVAPDGIEEQTELALRNLEAVLTAAGASLETVVKPPSSMRTSMTSRRSMRSMRGTCRTRRRLVRHRRMSVCRGTCSSPSTRSPSFLPANRVTVAACGSRPGT